MSEPPQPVISLYPLLIDKVQLVWLKAYMTYMACMNYRKIQDIAIIQICHYLLITVHANHCFSVTI